MGEGLEDRASALAILDGMNGVGDLRGRVGELEARVGALEVVVEGLLKAIGRLEGVED